MKFNIILDENTFRTVTGEGTKVMAVNDAVAKGHKVTVIPAGYEFITMPMVPILGVLVHLV